MFLKRAGFITQRPTLGLDRGSEFGVRESFRVDALICSCVDALVAGWGGGAVHVRTWGNARKQSYSISKEDTCKSCQVYLGLLRNFSFETTQTPLWHMQDKKSIARHVGSVAAACLVKSSSAESDSDDMSKARWKM